MLDELKMHYTVFYDAIIKEIDILKLRDISGDYRLIKALAACYELQEYTANQLAEYADDADC